MENGNGLRMWSAGPVRTVLAPARVGGKTFDGRDPQDVERVACLCGWSESVLQAEQVHGDRILLPGEQGSADGFLLERGMAAAVRHADCFPVCVADPENARAVLLHCGWKGTNLELARQGVELLASRGGSPDVFQAALGPGIGSLDFEVGPEVLECFAPAFRGRSRRETPSVDLGACLQAQLVGAGLRPDNVAWDRRSTFAHPDLHSYRRDGAHSGRMLVLCMIAQV